MFDSICRHLLVFFLGILVLLFLCIIVLIAAGITIFIQSYFKSIVIGIVLLSGIYYMGIRFHSFIERNT